MPKEAGERQWVFATDAGGTRFISLLEICLAVHMDTTGSSDDLTPSQREYHIETLAVAVEHWREGLPRTQRFDDAVKSLIQATLDEAKSLAVN